MVKYGEARITLTNTQLEKVKFAAKTTGTTIRKTKKNCQDHEFPH